MKQSKREAIDRSLLFYGGLVTFALTGIAFFNLNNRYSIITLILFLPVSIYFIIRLLLALNQKLHDLLNLGQQRRPYFGNFSLVSFVNQSETTFLINATLLTVAVTLIFFRISLDLIK